MALLSLRPFTKEDYCMCHPSSAIVRAVFYARERSDLFVLSKPIADVMTRNPVSIQADSLAVEILKLVEKKPVDDIVVLNADGTFAGMVDI